MIKKSIVGMLVCLLFMTNAWALTPVLDTGDPNERVCNPKSYTDLGNGIVRDNVTGLEWVQDGNLIASRDSSFDNDSETGDGAVTWQHALDYVDLLNTDGFLGHRDWRLPTILELSTLVDAGREYPAIDPIFSGALSMDYWSSTVHPFAVGDAWTVGFSDGTTGFNDKDISFYLRPVRGGAYGPFGSFVINGDGTVTDGDTGLMWQHCNYGQIWDEEQCTGSAEAISWDEAVAYIRKLNKVDYLGYDDWRLPTKNELQTQIDYSIYFPATTFPDTHPVGFYWSSTADSSNTTSVWAVDFTHGTVNVTDMIYHEYFRAVRGEACGTCELSIKHKPIYSAKLTKPRKVELQITGGEKLDVFGRIDLGPLTWEKVQFSRKKNQLKIHAIVPAGLKPGSIPIRVGDCFGEVVITGTITGGRSAF